MPVQKAISWIECLFVTFKILTGAVSHAKKKKYSPVKAGNQPTELQQERRSDTLTLAWKHEAASGIFFQSLFYLFINLFLLAIPTRHCTNTRYFLE